MLTHVVSIGRWWFRNRSFSPLPVLLLLLVVPPDFEMDAGLFLVGLVGVFFAESLRVWAVMHAGSTTRTRRDEAQDLVTTGPYQWTRNPLYVANILLYSSFCFLFGHIVLTVVALAYFAVQYSMIVRYEEGLLGALWGQRYLEYLKTVPRWVLGRRRLPPGRDFSAPFNFAQAIRSERSTLLAIALMGCLWITRFLWRG